MMLGNKYNHSIDFRKGKISACKYPHALLHSSLFTRDYLKKAGGIFFNILSRLINIVLLESKAQELFDLT